MTELCLGFGYNGVGVIWTVTQHIVITVLSHKIATIFYYEMGKVQECADSIT